MKLKAPQFSTLKLNIYNLEEDFNCNQRDLIECGMSWNLL